MNVVIPHPIKVLSYLAAAVVTVYVATTLVLAGLIVLICVAASVIWTSLKIRWGQKT